jgi:hypothetical protein
VALVNKFHKSQSGDRFKLYLYDDTGSYSVLNPGGFGAPNPVIGNVTSDSFEIQAVGSSDVYTVNAFPTLPNLTGVAFEVANTDLGLTADDVIPDGQYIIKRTTTANAVDYVYQKRVFLIAGLQCCADEMLASEKADCGCSGKELSPSATLNYALFTLKKAVSHYKFEKAQAIFEFAQSICDNKNCKTC